jgi:hypothetical protein
MKRGTPRRGYQYKISCTNIHATFLVSSIFAYLLRTLLEKFGRAADERRQHSELDI